MSNLLRFSKKRKFKKILQINYRFNLDSQDFNSKKYKEHLEKRSKFIKKSRFHRLS